MRSEQTQAYRIVQQRPVELSHNICRLAILMYEKSKAEKYEGKNKEILGTIKKWDQSINFAITSTA